MEQISWTDFAKVDFRVGEIKEAIKVEGSEKLIRMVIDLGKLGKKIVFSGIRQWYAPEDLIGKKTIFVVNMTVKKIMGEDSEAMIFAAEDEESKEVSIITLDRDLANGSRVF